VLRDQPCQPIVSDAVYFNVEILWFQAQQRIADRPANDYGAMPGSS
jgi:hypothetical protein